MIDSATLEDTEVFGINRLVIRLVSRVSGTKVQSLRAFSSCMKYMNPLNYVHKNQAPALVQEPFCEDFVECACCTIHQICRKIESIRRTAVNI
jgi:hypothetical protein